MVTGQTYMFTLLRKMLLFTQYNSELKKDQNSDRPSFTTQQSSFRLWKYASSSWKVVIEKKIFNSVCSENCNKPELLSGAESADSDCPDLLMELPVCT